MKMVISSNRRGTMGVQKSYLKFYFLCERMKDFIKKCYSPYKRPYKKLSAALKSETVTVLFINVLLIIIISVATTNVHIM